MNGMIRSGFLYGIARAGFLFIMCALFLAEQKVGWIGGWGGDGTEVKGGKDLCIFTYAFTCNFVFRKLEV